MSANGKLSPSELTIVQRGQLPIALANACAEQWVNMKTEYDRSHADELSIAVPVGGYRSYATQADMHRRPELYGLSTTSAIRLAQPGYSTHGDGMAVDVADASANNARKRWLLANASKYGFTRQFGEADPNHYRLTSTPAGTGTKIITEERRNIVRIIQDATTQEYWRVGESSALLLASSVAAQEAAVWGNGIVLPSATVAQVVADARTVGASLAAASKGAGGTVDNTPVLDVISSVATQITNLDTKVTNFPPPPTANDVATETIRQMKLPGN